MNREQVIKLKVKDVMNRDVVAAHVDDPISDVLSRMQKNDFNVMPVVDDDSKFQGIISYDSLNRRRSLPLTAKASSVMMNCPEVRQNDVAIDVVEQLIANELKGLPVLSKKRVIGIITRSDIIKAFKSLIIMKEIRNRDIMNENIPSISPRDTITAARKILNEINERNIAVVENGRLVGVVGLKDIVRANYTDNRKQTKAINRKYKRESGPVDVEVEAIMVTAPVTLEPEDTILKTVDLMDKHNISTVFITEDGLLKGVVSEYALLELFHSFRPQDGVYVQISGLSDEPPDVFDILYEMIEKSMKRVSKLLKPKILTIHVSRYNSDEGSRQKYSLTARLTTEHEMIYGKSFEWDLFKAMDDTLEQIEKAARKVREKKKEKTSRK